MVNPIFISFASNDADLAHRVVEKLERAGLRCWISDRDIQPATSYPAAITAAVKNCGALLLLLTESSNSSPHVLREVELAFNARRPILPVRVSGATPASDLQYFLSTSQWFDAGSAFDDADLAKVEPHLRELLKGERPGGGGQTNGTRWWLWVGVAAALIIAAVATGLFWSGRRGEPPAAAPDVAAATGPTVPATRGGETASRLEVKVNPRDGQAYVWVPPGRFIMGCSTADPACEDDEKPPHAVNITRGFWLARTEVTGAQYRTAARSAAAARAGTDEELPVTEVSWGAAKAYCAAVGGQLPSEAEWEYAARAGTSTRSYDSLAAIAWFDDNSEGRAHPVGMKAPNAFGLYDMLGNVSEWVRDRYYNAYDDSSDPSIVEEPLAGNASGVARGGSWVSDAQGIRVSRRLEMPPDAEEVHIGFRCAVDKL